MSNLFNIFDPNTLFMTQINWLRTLRFFIFIPSSYWIIKRNLNIFYIKIIFYLKKEFSGSIRNLLSPGLVYIILISFIFIIFNNFLRLFPWVFRTSRHLRFTIVLAVPFWLGYIRYNIYINRDLCFAHLLPLGTPYLLIPFIVIIEIIRNFIRPLALSVRLAANLIAGHTLIAVLTFPIEISINIIIYIIIILILILLFILEIGVSIIQAYVFRMLISLYVAEVNSPNL